MIARRSPSRPAPERRAGELRPGRREDASRVRTQRASTREGSALYGCLGARRTRLGTLRGTVPFPATRIALYALSGRYAGIDTAQMGVDTFSSTVTLVDLRHRRDARDARPRRRPSGGPSPSSRVTAMAIDANGTLAWIGRRSAIGVPTPTYEVHALNARPQPPARERRRHRPNSLRLHGDTLSWRSRRADPLSDALTCGRRASRLQRASGGAARGARSSIAHVELAQLVGEPGVGAQPDLLERGEVGLEVGEAAHPELAGEIVVAEQAELVDRARQRLGGLDLDPAVALEPGRRRDQLADDHVLLEPVEAVDLALERGVGQDLRRLLEGGRREERVGVQRRLRDAEDDVLELRRLAAGLRDQLARARELEAVDELPGQVARCRPSGRRGPS